MEQIIGKFLNFNRAMTQVEPSGQLVPVAHYTFLPLKAKCISLCEECRIIQSGFKCNNTNDAFRTAQLPAAANGFAVFTGRTLTYICLCRSHSEASWAIRCVPPYEHHPGTLKLNEELAIQIVLTYLNGLDMFGLDGDNDYVYFGHQRGVEYGEASLGKDGKLFQLHVVCNSREGFIPKRIPTLLENHAGEREHE